MRIEVHQWVPVLLDVYEVLAPIQKSIIDPKRSRILGRVFHAGGIMNLPNKEDREELSDRLLDKVRQVAAIPREEKLSRFLRRVVDTGELSAFLLGGEYRSSVPPGMGFPLSRLYPPSLRTNTGSKNGDVPLSFFHDAVFGAAASLFYDKVCPPAESFWVEGVKYRIGLRGGKVWIERLDVGDYGIWHNMEDEIAQVEQRGSCTLKTFDRIESVPEKRSRDDGRLICKAHEMRIHGKIRVLEMSLSGDLNSSRCVDNFNQGLKGFEEWAGYSFLEESARPYVERALRKL